MLSFDSYCKYLNMLTWANSLIAKSITRSNILVEILVETNFRPFRLLFYSLPLYVMFMRTHYFRLLRYE